MGKIRSWIMGPLDVYSRLGWDKNLNVGGLKSWNYYNPVLRKTWKQIFISAGIVSKPDQISKIFKRNWKFLTIWAAQKHTIAAAFTEWFPETASVPILITTAEHIFQGNIIASLKLNIFFNVKLLIVICTAKYKIRRLQLKMLIKCLKSWT